MFKTFSVYLASQWWVITGLPTGLANSGSAPDLSNDEEKSRLTLPNTKLKVRGENEEIGASDCFKTTAEYQA